MTPAKINFKVYQGSTFQETFRWESETKTYLPITNISKSAPCVITTQETPQLPIGWRFRVVGAGGMKEINSAGDTWYLATAVDMATNTLEVNSINSLQYSSYTSGGVVEYNTPVDLYSYSARMQIRKTIDSNEVIYSLSTSDGSIVIDNLLSTITLTIPASITTGFTFSSAVYSLELYNDTDYVVPFLTGNLTLVPEVTR